MPRWFLQFLIVYTACGLVLSLVVHVASFAGLRIGGDTLFGALVGGSIPAFFSVILIGRLERKKKRGIPDKEIDHWELVLAGCPVALKYLFWGCFFYAWGLGMVTVFWQSHDPNTGGRVALALFMTFYAMGLAVGMAAWRRARARHYF